MPVLCAICGLSPGTTKDHIPPKNLYPKPIDNDINLNTVPACSSCNNGSSSDDEIFKVLIGMETGEYQRDPQKIIDSLAATVGKNARVSGQIFSTKRRVLAGLRGPILEPAVSVHFDFKPYERVISRMVRALHWMEAGRVMALDAVVEIFPGAQLTPSLATDWMSLMHLLPLKKLNKETLSYRYHLGDDGTHFWGMQFFSRHTTFVLVHEPATPRVEA
jgi:hypothetical protein